ncbi:MAG: 3'-5' exonuclease [Catenibacillus sp.]|mgnify:FL=1|nr:3'-5' exonuclease [Catenibacillus sp.]
MVKDYVAFDLETTGLNCERDEIIEIGALKVKDGKVTERFARLIQPKLSVPPEITAITGITNEMLESAPPVEKVIPEFVLFCRDEILLGHNVMFDYKFTKVYAKRYGLPFEKKGLDTLKIARKVLPELESRSLGALCEHYEIVNQAAHRAYHDALATAKIYHMLAHFYEEKYPALFEPESLVYHQKKVSPATAKQKAYLNELLKYHKIEFNQDMDTMTKSEMSRMIDKIILVHGRMF